MLQAVDGGILHIQVNAQEDQHQGEAGYQGLRKNDLNAHENQDEKHRSKQTHPFLLWNFPVLLGNQQQRCKAMHRHTQEAQIDGHAHGIVGGGALDKIQILEEIAHENQKHAIEQPGQANLPFLFRNPHGDGNPIPEQQRDEHIIGGIHSKVQQQIQPPGHLVQKVHGTGGNAVEDQGKAGGIEACVEELVAAVGSGEPNQIVALFDIDDLHIKQDQQGHDLGFAPL